MVVIFHDTCITEPQASWPKIVQELKHKITQPLLFCVCCSFEDSTPWTYLMIAGVYCFLNQNHAQHGQGVLHLLLTYFNRTLFVDTLKGGMTRVMDLSSKAKERNRERPDSLNKEMNIGSSRLWTTKVQLNLARHFYLNAIRKLIIILLRKYFGEGSLFR